MNLTWLFLSLACYALATLFILAIGGLYAFRSKLMPYHLDALETDWQSLPSNQKILFKALLNGGGFFGLAMGLFMLTLLLIPFRNAELWAGYAIGVIGLVGTVPLGFIVRTVKTKTAGNPPFAVLIFPVVLLMVGLAAFATEHIIVSY